jgi:hypothetical protein
VITGPASFLATRQASFLATRQAGDFLLVTFVLLNDAMEP